MRSLILAVLIGGIIGAAAFIAVVSDQAAYECVQLRK